MDRSFDRFVIRADWMVPSRLWVNATRGRTIASSPKVGFVERVSPLGRTIFGLFAFLPLIGVLADAVYLTLAVDPARFAARPERMLHGETGTALMFALGGCVAIAFLQIALGAVVAIHTSKRSDMSSGEKAAWSFACIFVGSFALPLFFFLKSKAPALPMRTA